MSDAAGAIMAFRRFQRPAEETRALERISRDPQQTRAMDQFRRGLDRATDIRTALRDPRVLQVVAMAMGIPDATQQAGLAMRALLSDPADPKSLVNRLPDKRWKAASEALRLDERGLDALRDPEVQARLAEGLHRAKWREELEASQPGLGDALLFRDRAPKADGPFGVLGDPVLRRVVSGAIGLPQSIAVQSVETQARALESRLKLDKLRDPREVQRLAERYLISRAGESAGAFGAPSSATSNALALLGLPPGGLRI